MRDGQTFLFISFLILKTTYDWDGQTFYVIPHIGIHVWLRRTDRHFISFLILETTYDWDILWRTETETDRDFISFLIFETTYDRRTYFLCHSSYCNPPMTDGHTFHFIPHIGIHVWQTDRQHFISFLILETTYDRRTDNISFHSSY